MTLRAPSHNARTEFLAATHWAPNADQKECGGQWDFVTAQRGQRRGAVHIRHNFSVGNPLIIVGVSPRGGVSGRAG